MPAIGKVTITILLRNIIVSRGSKDRDELLANATQRLVENQRAAKAAAEGKTEKKEGGDA